MHGRVMAVAIAGWFCLGLVACSQQESTAPAARVDDAAVSQATTAASQQAKLASLGAEELRERGHAALRAQRIYAPAGDNAMECYLALRKISPTPDVAAESALMDLQPYAVIAAEQAIARSDFVEAERLQRLISAADPLAPSLERIADGIAQGRQRMAQEALTAAEAAPPTPEVSAPQPATADAPRPLAVAPVPASQPMARSPVSAPEAVAAASSPIRSDASPVRTQTAPPPTAQAPAQAAVAEPVTLRAPLPAYPPEEKRFGHVVEVTATFVVNADGSVGDIDAKGHGGRSAVFERTVKMTLRRWQFAPMAQAMTITRRFTFTP